MTPTRFFGGLLTAFLLLALSVAACGPNAGTPSVVAPGGEGTNGVQAAPDSTFVTDQPPTATAPTSGSSPDSSSGADTNARVSQEVKGREISAHVTYWRGVQSGTLLNKLQYKLFVDLTSDPANKEQVVLKYEIYGPNGIYYTEEKRGLFDTLGAYEYKQAFSLPGPGTYTVDGDFDGEKFSLNIEVFKPPAKLGALAPDRTWDRVGIPKSEIGGLFSLEGLWDGATIEWDGKMSKINQSWLEIEFDAAYLDPMAGRSGDWLYCCPMDRRSKVHYEMMGLAIHYTGTFGYVGGQRSVVVGTSCSVDQKTFEIDGWLEFQPRPGISQFSLQGWSGTVNLDTEPDLVITPRLLDKPSAISNPGLPDAIGGPVDELGFGIVWLFGDDPLGEVAQGCRRERETVFAARRVSELAGGPISGQVVASVGSGTTVIEGRVELHRTGDEGGEPAFATTLKDDGSFAFSDVPSFVRVDGEIERAVYTLTVKDARGPAQTPGDDSTKIVFEPGIVAGIFGLTEHEILLEAQAPGPPTHFIAIGDRAVAVSASPVFHYSLEYWQCGGDFRPLDHTDGFTPAEIVAKCQAFGPAFLPKKLGEVELLARTGWDVWAGVDDRYGPVVA